MKKLLTANTRWEYYVANIGGFVIVLALIVWLIKLSYREGMIEFGSVSFWLSLPLMLLIPFAMISFLSSMKNVIVTKTGLLISYRFKKHVIVVSFSEVEKIEPGVAPTAKQISPRIGDSFKLILSDNRIFEFSRAQFNDYQKLRTLVYNAVDVK